MGVRIVIYKSFVLCFVRCLLCRGSVSQFRSSGFLVFIYDINNRWRCDFIFLVCVFQSGDWTATIDKNQKKLINTTEHIKTKNRRKSLTLQIHNHSTENHKANSFYSKQRLFVGSLFYREQKRMPNSAMVSEQARNINLK